MGNIDVIPIESTFRLRVCDDELPPYPETVNQQVDNIWSHMTRLTDWDLFDGKVFQLDEFHEDHITGTFNNYRYFYAQNCKVELKESLQITLVAVTGVLKCEDRYLLAKRSSQVTQFPMKWEFAPSGGISIDYLTDHEVAYENQLYDELIQEVGMDEEFVIAIKPFLLIWDKDEMLVDICAHIEVDPLGMATASYYSPEYVAYEWLKREEIPQFLKDHEAIPTTKIISDH
nr:hypothetical protein [Chlamydiota bacterium]